ncbi:MAG: GABA permease, partial [Actinobacteria bacterium]|nr:GABA permease [Actinomycetota bacterium]
AYPYLTYFAILGMLSIVAAMALIPDQQLPLLFGVVSLLVLLLAYVPRLVWGRRTTEGAVPAGSRAHGEL